MSKRIELCSTAEVAPGNVIKATGSRWLPKLGGAPDGRHQSVPRSAGRASGRGAARASARGKSARDLIAGDIRNGIVDLRFRIDAEDADGTVVYSLPFRHALNIIPEAA